MVRVLTRAWAAASSGVTMRTWAPQAAHQADTLLCRYRTLSVRSAASVILILFISPLRFRPGFERHPVLHSATGRHLRAALLSARARASTKSSQNVLNWGPNFS